jgi:urate oxidase
MFSDAKACVVSGLNDLRILKTTQSSFINFVDDEYRSLPDQHDRIFR